MCVARVVLFAGCCLLCGMYCLLLSWLVFVVCCLPCVVASVLAVVWCSMFVDCYPLCVVGCLLFWCLSFVVCCMYALFAV